MIHILLFLLLAIGEAAFAQERGIKLYDEGTLLGRIHTLDCSGDAITCTKSNATGTITISGGSVAPTTSQYWTGAADGSLSAEHNLGVLSTGLVLNTAGTPSVYAGTTCTNQVIRLLSASGAATCQTITSAYVDTSIWTGTVSSGLLKASSQGVLAQAVSGTDYVVPAGNVATATALAANGGNCAGNEFAIGVNASGVSECAQPAFSNLSGSATDGQIPNNITVDLATSATTAGALAVNGGNCSGNNFALGVDASGVGECAQPAFSNLSGSATDAQVPNTITLDNLTQITTRAISDTTGTLLVPRGGSGLITVAANQLYVGTAADTFTAKTLPSCSNGTTDKLLYNNSTNEFSCGTDQGGAGGGLSHDQTMTRISYGF